jgi:hypothetical protein
MLISNIYPVKQIQKWKSEYDYDAKDRVSKVYEYMNNIQKYTDANYPDKTYMYMLKMENINNFYRYLNNNPEFLCHAPLFLKQSGLRANDFLNELESIKNYITDDLYNSVLTTLKYYIDLSTYIELI